MSLSKNSSLFHMYYMTNSIYLPIVLQDATISVSVSILYFDVLIEESLLHCFIFPVLNMSWYKLYT